MQTLKKRPTIDSWFRPELKATDYGSFGDAYDDEKYMSIAKQWAIKDDYM